MLPKALVITPLTVIATSRSGTDTSMAEANLQVVTRGQL